MATLPWFVFIVATEVAVVGRGLSNLPGIVALIRRNLDQAAVGIPAVDRPQRAAGALFGDRAFLDRHAARLEMRDHLFWRARCQKAQIVAAGRYLVRRE